MCLGTQRSQSHVTQIWQTNPLPSSAQASSYFMTTLRTAAVGIAVLSFIIFLATGDPTALTVSGLCLIATLALFLPDDYSSTSGVVYMPSSHRRHDTYYPMPQMAPQIVPVPLPLYMPPSAVYVPPPTIPAFHQSFSHVLPNYAQRGPLRTREHPYPYPSPSIHPTYSGFGGGGFNPAQRGTLRERSI